MGRAPSLNVIGLSSSAANEIMQKTLWPSRVWGVNRAVVIKENIRVRLKSEVSFSSEQNLWYYKEMSVFFYHRRSNVIPKCHSSSKKRMPKNKMSLNREACYRVTLFCSFCLVLASVGVGPSCTVRVAILPATRRATQGLVVVRFFLS